MSAFQPLSSPLWALTAAGRLSAASLLMCQVGCLCKRGKREEVEKDGRSACRQPQLSSDPSVANKIRAITVLGLSILRLLHHMGRDE